MEPQGCLVEGRASRGDFEGRFGKQEEVQERMVSWEPKEVSIFRTVANCVSWVRIWFDVMM